MSDSSSNEYTVERRADGSILVRVAAREAGGEGEPSRPAAVFTFRVGDPQFARWDRWLRERPT